MALISLKRLSDGVSFQIEESNILLVFASTNGVIIEHRDTVNGTKDTVEVSNAIAEIVSISERLMLIHYSDNSPSVDLYIDHNRITDVYLEGSYASVIYNKGNNEVVNFKTVDSVATILSAVYAKKGYFTYAVDDYSGDTIRLGAGDGNVTGKFTVGKVITVYGALEENNDTYVVASSAFAGGKTTITLATGTGVSDDTDATGRIMIKSLTNSEIESELGAAEIVFTKGTVTQITAITTGVTVNAPAGVITTVSSTLAAGSNATFIVTNSYVTATSVVQLTVDDSATAGLAKLNVQTVGAGVFSVNVTNIHGASAFNNILKIHFLVV